MLADPFVVGVNNVTNPETRFAIIRNDGYGSERVDRNGGGYVLIINHTTGKAGNRHYLKLSKSVDAMNPYTGLTQKQVASVSLSISSPAFGFTDSDMNLLTLELSSILFDTEVTPLALIQFQS